MTVRKLFLDHNTFARIAMCLTLIAVMSIVAGFSKINKNVRVIADGKTTVIDTMHHDPAKIISQAGVKISDTDKYSMSTRDVKDGTTITIQRAVPVVIKVEDNTKRIKTAETNVQALLKKMGYDALDFYISPNEETSIIPNMLIRLEPLTNKMVFREENAPFETVYQDDSSLPAGETKVIQQGIDGVDQFTVKEYYNGGKKVDEQILQRSVIKQPIPEIVARGTYSSAGSDDGQVPPYTSVLHVQASAYLPTDGGGGGYTATGMRAQHGVVAVDPNIIPLGTKLYIPGYGVAVAADTGGFSGYTIDLCVESYAEAINWGRRSINVYILPD